MKNLLLVAAENSAENYALQVLDAFAAGGAPVAFFGVGGERLAARGMEVVVPVGQVSVVGIFELLGHLRAISRALDLLASEAERRRADAALLIDFPDFNLRLAGKLGRLGIPVYHYIAPTVWAWRYNRVRTLRQRVGHEFLIYPFEVPIFERERIPHTYVGHPLLAGIQPSGSPASFRQKEGLASGDRVVALLPGSRAGEVEALLPVFLQALDRMPPELRLRAFLVRAHSIDPARIESLLAGRQVRVVSQERQYEVLTAADLVVTSCGTANLEAALLGAPQLAAYRIHPLTYKLGRPLVRISRYSIVNILAGEALIPELIQHHCTPSRVAGEMLSLLTDEERRAAMRRGYERIRGLLDPGIEPPAVTIAKKIRADLKI